MSDPAPLTAVPVNENVPPTDKPALLEPATAPLPAAMQPHGRWFPVTCAALALLGAAIALAAPGLRPIVAEIAADWFDADDVTALLLAPSPVQAAAIQSVQAQLAATAARLDRLAAAQQATAAEVARALADWRAEQSGTETLSRTVDDLKRQTDALRADTVATDARGRAAGLLALSLRLRRDLDAGLPLDRGVMALAASGPYPQPIERALQQLRGANDGVPTMRDLADELDRIIAILATRSSVETTWLNAGWSRLAAAFGGNPPAGDAALIARLRALAAEGRFTEAASVLQASPGADVGANWAARVSTRVHAVLATQTLLSYSLSAYESAFAATGIR